MSDSVVLGFDTSGGWLGTALFRDDDVVAATHFDMAKGQAERLMPAIVATLEEAHVTFGDLTAIGVGVGPGNFTGIRISVATARGLALGRGIPAIGVSLMDALALNAPRPVLACLNGPRDQLYLQRFGDGIDRGPALVHARDLDIWVAPHLTVIGQNSPDLAARLGLKNAPAAYAPASGVARIAARRVGGDHARPTPLYIRPPAAAPAPAVPPVA